MRTTAGRDCDLDGVASGLTDIFEVKGFMGRLVVSPLNVEWGSVNTDCHRCWPVGAHLPVFMVEAFQLEFKVRSVHEGVVDSVPQLKCVIADRQIVF